MQTKSILSDPKQLFSPKYKWVQAGKDDEVYVNFSGTLL